MKDVRRKAGAAVATDFAHTAGTPVVINTTRGDLSVINDAGAIRSALIAVSATATLDFPSVSSNAMATLTMTVTGAAVGKPALAAPPAAFETGFTFIAFVSAPDTVKISIHNNTGGSVDPVSADWTVYVLL